MQGESRDLTFVREFREKNFQFERGINEVVWNVIRSNTYDVFFFMLFMNLVVQHKKTR